MADLRLGDVDAHVQLGGLEQARGRRVRGDDVAGPEVQRLDARGARRADHQLGQHHVDLLQAPARGVDHPLRRLHVLGRPLQQRVDLGAQRRHLRVRAAQPQRRVVGVDARGRAAGVQLAHPFLVLLGLRLRRPLRLQPRLRLGDLGAARAGQRARELLQRPLRLRQLSLGDQALRGQVALLQRDDGLAGGDHVPLADVHLLDAAADARSDLDRPRFHGTAPLERRARLTQAVDAVAAERQGDDHQKRDPALHGGKAKPGFGLRDGYREEESAPGAKPALHPDPTVVRLDDSLRDVEAETHAAAVLRLALPVALEQVLLLVLGDPWTVVGDGETDVAASGPAPGSGSVRAPERT